VSEASPSRWPASLAVARVREDGWRAWREIRLAALADAPDSFADTLAETAALPGREWRAMIRAGAIFIASAGPEPVGVAAGCRARRRPSAVWVRCGWRRRGAAAVRRPCSPMR
jgi:hypothetical protein